MTQTTGFFVIALLVAVGCICILAYKFFEGLLYILAALGVPA